jgi:hypothetical protein
MGPRVQKQGPEALRGLFWLTDQKDSSSLVSFARSNDGGNMGQGELRQGRYAFSVRVGGDRSWSFADNVFGGNFETVELLDLVYNFKEKSGSLQNPTAFSIIPEARNLGAKLEGKFGEWLLGFDMVKLASENATAAGYSGSIVWDRISSAFGQDIDSAATWLFRLLMETATQFSLPMISGLLTWPVRLQAVAQARSITAKHSLLMVLSKQSLKAKGDTSEVSPSLNAEFI